MASIDIKPNGTYRIRVNNGKDANGKRIVETMMYTPTAKSPTKIEKEVQKVALDFEERVKSGQYISGDKTTFDEYIPVWRDQWASDNLTQSALESYQNAIRIWASPSIGNVAIGAIRPQDIQNIVTTMKNKGRKPKSIRRTITAINSVMKFAYDMEIVENNPVDRVRIPKNPSKDELHYFTVEQVNRFFEALERSYPYTSKEHTSKSRKTGETFSVKAYSRYTTIPFQWRVYFNLAVYGSFRRGELVGLQWRDIDWDKRTISLKRAVAKVKGGQVVKTTKTCAGIRTVTLPTVSMNLLREWYAMEKELSLKLGTCWEGKTGKEFDENYVFIQLDSGLVMNVDTPTGKFREIIELYNATCENEDDKLPVIRLHDLRHTSATLMLSNGVDIATVSHRLGHAHTSVTLDVYSHWLEDKDEKASDTLENLLRKTV